MCRVGGGSACYHELLSSYLAWKCSYLFERQRLTPKEIHGKGMCEGGVCKRGEAVLVGCPHVCRNIRTPELI